MRALFIRRFCIRRACPLFETEQMTPDVIHPLIRFHPLSKKKSLYINDLFIVLMKHNLGSGIDYLLVYKNFENRGEALNYCEKYLHFIENCLIVNVQNLE